jgi:hypothetical protein
MSKSENRPAATDAADVASTVQNSVEHAGKTAELTQEDLDSAAGGGRAPSDWYLPIVTPPEI